MITEEMIEEIRDNCPSGKKEIEFYLEDRFMYSIPVDAWQYGNNKEDCKKIALLHITDQIEKEYFDAHGENALYSTHYTNKYYGDKSPVYHIFIKFRGGVMEVLPLYRYTGDEIPF